MNRKLGDVWRKLFSKCPYDSEKLHVVLFLLFQVKSSVAIAQALRVANFVVSFSNGEKLSICHKKGKGMNVKTDNISKEDSGFFSLSERLSVTK